MRTNRHIHVDLALSLLAGGRLPRAVDAGRSRAHRVLRLRRRAHLADDAEDGELQDDDRRPADEPRLRRVRRRIRCSARSGRCRWRSSTGGAATACSSAPRSASRTRYDLGRCSDSFLAAMATGDPGRHRDGGLGARLHPADGRPAAVRRRPPDDQRHRQLSAARGAVLHPGRQPDEQRRHHQPDLRLRARAGRLAAGRARSRQHHRLGDLRRHVGHRDRGCRGPRHDRDQGDARQRLRPRLLRRRHRGVGHARPDHSAVAAVRHLRDDGQRVGRPALRRRHRPGRRDGHPDDAARSRYFAHKHKLGRRHRVRVAPHRQGVRRARDRDRLAARDLGPR